MYASVRVHQSKDYSPRDDMWSLMYVFCDLASGGLPWMQHAATRDREACRMLKERIHGEVEGIPDQTEQLLKGNEYHVALHEKTRGDIDAPPPPSNGDQESSLPTPLAMSRDKRKVQLLRTAFDHLGKLSYFDMPDYALLQSCIKGFLDDLVEEPSVAFIDWRLLASIQNDKKSQPAIVTNDKSNNNNISEAKNSAEIEELRTRLAARWSSQPTKKEWLIGTNNDNQDERATTFIIMEFNQYVHLTNWKGEDLSLNSFKSLLRGTERIERLIAEKKLKQEQHSSKWNKIFDLMR